jgi:leucyl-tRNA synthetase
MSKSKKNIVDPDDIIKIYGSDAVRWFILSDSPPDRDIQWSDSGIQGAYKYIQNIWRTCEKISSYQKINENFDKIFLIKIDILVKEISECVEKFQMNVAVAKLYTFLNLINEEVEKLGVDKKGLLDQYNARKDKLLLVIHYLDQAGEEEPVFTPALTRMLFLSAQPEFLAKLSDNEKKRRVGIAIQKTGDSPILRKILHIESVFGKNMQIPFGIRHVVVLKKA